ncbi:MAG: hypothetical protein OXQ29_03005 [Rhodospirillaceae bacterium]|nr:hypothetical protein [Rhodospirillaceae bacterium]
MNLTLCLIATLGCWSANEALSRNSYNDVPILILADDGAADTVERSHSIVGTVIAKLQDSMGSAGFRVIDEEAIAGDLRWKIRNRRAKSELIQIAKLMSKSDRAEHQVRVLVLFRTRPMVKPLRSVTRVRVEIDGEIHDILSNHAVGKFGRKSAEMMLPPDRYGRAAGCGAECSSVLRGLAVEIAGGLGEELAAKLAPYRRVHAAGQRNGKPEGDPGGGIAIPYTVTLLDFERREALAIVGAMVGEFPGYRSHDLISQTPGVRRYTYLTTASAARLEEWLANLLGDMNLEKDVVTRIRENRIVVEKIGAARGSRR